VLGDLAKRVLEASPESGELAQRNPAEEGVEADASAFLTAVDA